MLHDPTHEAMVEHNRKVMEAWNLHRDSLAIHAHIEDVKLAEDQLAEDIGAAGMLDVDPLTLRIKARYSVADRMLRVRGETPIGQGIATLLPDHEANQKKETR